MLLKNAVSSIELALAERVEFVVVAHRAARRQAEPDLRRRLRAVARVQHQVFFGDGAALVGRDVAAIEAGGHLLVERAIGQQVAGQLLDRELIEGHVSIEGSDHPVAIRPHLAVVVEMNAVRVGVASGVEPVAAPVLAPVGRFQQLVDKFFVGSRRSILDESLHHVGGQAAGRSGRGRRAGPACAGRPPAPGSSRPLRAWTG